MAKSKENDCKLSIKTKRNAPLYEWGKDNCNLLIDAITEHAKEIDKRRLKSKVVLRKHIKWGRVCEILENKGVKIDENDVKQKWARLIVHVQIERALEDILPEARTYIQKSLRPIRFGAYQLFYQKYSKKIKNRHPDYSMTDLAYAVSNKWKKANEKKRAKYALKAEKRNNDLYEKFPEFVSKRPNTRLPFKLDVPFPPPTLFAYFSSQQTDKFQDRSHRTSELRYRFHNLKPHEFSKYNDEYAEILKKFDDYVKTLPQDKRDCVEIRLSNRSKRRINETLNNNPADSDQFSES